MNYIVFDLEWNQPMSKNSAIYKKIGKALSCELIQIGAVKLDEKKRMIASFNQYIAPSFYKKLNPRISKITGISQKELDSAPSFEKAFSNFISWCGNDSALISWGADDIQVLAKNMSLFPVNKNIPNCFDAQNHFSQLMQTGKNRLSLRNAMSIYDINPSPDHEFHNAVDDAYYTALVIQKLGDMSELKEYECSINWDKINERHRINEQNDIERKVRSINATFETGFALKPPCPICGKETSVTEGYLPEDRYNWLGLSDCPTHGLVKTHLNFTKAEKSGFIVKRFAELSEEQHPAYIKTKHIQWAKKISELNKKENKNVNRNRRKQKKL